MALSAVGADRGRSRLSVRDACGQESASVDNLACNLSSSNKILRWFLHRISNACLLLNQSHEMCEPKSLWKVSGVTRDVGWGGGSSAKANGIQTPMILIPCTSFIRRLTSQDILITLCANIDVSRSRISIFCVWIRIFSTKRWQLKGYQTLSIAYSQHIGMWLLFACRSGGLVDFGRHAFYEHVGLPGAMAQR